jgi:hypothetical protein
MLLDENWPTSIQRDEGSGNDALQGTVNSPHASQVLTTDMLMPPGRAGTRSKVFAITTERHVRMRRGTFIAISAE